MISILIAFFTSFIASIAIIKTKKLHNSYTGDIELRGPQKFHTSSIPRVGGIAIFFGIFTSIAINYLINSQEFIKFILIICTLPVFGVGLMEDLTKNISIRTRLLFTALGAFMACLLLNCQITNTDIPVIDLALTIPMVSILFTMFAITGLANAYNIIDGFNGLSSMVGIITLIFLGYMGLRFGDSVIVVLSFTMASAILGFFLINYPRGLIFLGDGGAYLIGFWDAILSLLMVNRHHEISPWFAITINAYPIIETLFTIYRRKIHQGKYLGAPDGVHLHSLIFRRVLNVSKINSTVELFDANSRTSPYIWILATIPIIPAIIFYNSTLILIFSFALLGILYIWIYKKIIRFKIPKWIKKIALK
jgi:UDP-N-acetylmuramyl pentapeptide phosphotransferase/UDP-N-acetylglucosamine-1-phosphate transferase